MSEEEKKKPPFNPVLLGGAVALSVVLLLIVLLFAPSSEAQELSDPTQPEIVVVVEVEEAGIIDSSLQAIEDGSCYVVVKLTSKWDFELLRDFAEKHNCVVSITQEGTIE